MRKIGVKIYYSILFIVFSSLIVADPGVTVMKLDSENAKNYLSPMGTMLSMGMNSGYFQEASVHKPKGFDIKIDLAYVMFPPQRVEYEFIVPDTPIDVLFPLRFPKEKLQYKHPALLQYIPDTGEEGIYYDETIAVTMPLNTLLFSEPVATIIGESIADTIEFNFDRANQGNALYNKMLERVWSEIEGIDGIGKNFYVYNDENRLITILSPAYEDAQSFSEDFSEDPSLDLSETLESTLDTMNLDLILPGGFDYLFQELPISSGVPLPIIQAKIGLPLFSEFTIRGLPSIPISTIGKIQYISVGGKISLTNHLSKLFNLRPRYENYLDISSYTKIFSPNIRPKDVDKAMDDFELYDLDYREIDSLNNIFRSGNPNIVREIQNKIQLGLMKIKDMPRAQQDEDDNRFPIDLSYGYYINYYKFDMGGPQLTAVNKMGSFQFGKTYEPRFASWFGGIALYGGVGFESSDINLVYNYTNTLGEINDITVAFQGENTFRGIVGIRFRVLLVDTYFDYNIGGANTLNAGFGITIK